MYSPSQPGATPDPRIITPGDLKRERLKFTDFKFRRTPGGKCSAEVELEWIDGIRVRGTSAGQSSATVDLRVAADAALRAIETFSDNSLEFELVGVKSVRAFDATVVIVSVNVRKGEGPKKLLGACLAEDDPVRGAAVAVSAALSAVTLFAVGGAMTVLTGRGVLPRRFRSSAPWGRLRCGSACPRPSGLT